MADYKREYERWLRLATDEDIATELRAMSETTIEDAFYRRLVFGTGGLRGIIGAGTNRMNVYVVAAASQGLSNYLLKEAISPAVVIGYDSRKNSDIFAKTAASVFAANGIRVHLWPELTPVPSVSFSVRYLRASAGVMITASHNPSKYNGYKVYGSDGCQITTEAAERILSEIDLLDMFADIRTKQFDRAVDDGDVKYIEPTVFTEFIEAVKSQSVLFSDEINRNVAIVYSPLNGTGLKAVTRVLAESGFTNVTIVEEQRNPDGTFPTCPYPNPEIQEAMELGLKYCRERGADLLLATDPDCDRCGVAVRDEDEYRLLTGNEVGLLLLDYICSQRIKHGKMPEHPVFVKTIVTTDLAERIAKHYGVGTVNVLTGFKFIGEVIGKLAAQGNASDYIFGFEESCGYLTGPYVLDKDGVDAVYMICEMFAFYRTHGISLIEQLKRIYDTYGYCLNTLHSFAFPGSTGLHRMSQIMEGLHKGLQVIGGEKIRHTEDYSTGLNGLPKADMIKFFTINGSVVIRPSGTEPKIKAYISVTAEDCERAKKIECQTAKALEEMLK